MPTTWGASDQGSDEEAGHVLDAYNKYKGNMRAVIDSVMLATDGKPCPPPPISRALSRSDTTNFEGHENRDVQSG